MVNNKHMEYSLKYLICHIITDVVVIWIDSFMIYDLLQSVVCAILIAVFSLEASRNQINQLNSFLMDTEIEDTCFNIPCLWLLFANDRSFSIHM